MMRQIVRAAAGLWLCVASPLVAQSTQGVLVELYTSQGCSSCPPADAFLAKLVQQPGVIPLALHVDYWDYIGWEDTFGNPQHAKRQRAYAHAGGRKMVFTPQMIVAGGESVEGNRPPEVSAAIRRARAINTGVSLSLTRQGDTVVIRAEAEQPLTKGSKVQLVRYRLNAPVMIERGENAGVAITYHNVVVSWLSIGEWDGAAPLQMRAAAQGNEGLVVIIQTEGMAQVLAAAELQ